MNETRVREVRERIATQNTGISLADAEARAREIVGQEEMEDLEAELQANFDANRALERAERERLWQVAMGDEPASGKTFDQMLGDLDESINEELGRQK